MIAQVQPEYRDVVAAVPQVPLGKVLSDGITSGGLRKRGWLLACFLVLGGAARARASVIVLHPFDPTGPGAYSNLGPSNQQMADTFSLVDVTALESISWFGRYDAGPAVLSLTNPVAFSVRFFADTGGSPEVFPLAVFDVMVDALDTGLTFGGTLGDVPWFSYSTPLSLVLAPGYILGLGSGD